MGILGNIFGGSKEPEKPSGINTNPALRNPAQYEPIPYIFKVPQLTPGLLKILQSGHLSGSSFFDWHVKPGDHVDSKSVIGTFHLKPEMFWHTFEATLHLPVNGIITEINGISNAGHLFAYQPLMPTTQAYKYRNLPAELSELQTLEMKGSNYTQYIYWNVFEKICVINSRATKGNDNSAFINSERDGKMGDPVMIALRRPDYGPGYNY